MALDLCIEQRFTPNIEYFIFGDFVWKFEDKSLSLRW
jgi:hypothetical protein